MTRWFLILALLGTPAYGQMVVRRPAMYTGAPFCGDTIKNGSDACDGSDFGTDTCTTYGCSGGTLTCTGACVITLGSCTGCTGTPNLLNETFTGVGYAVAGWTAGGSGGTLDPDEAAACPVGTGFSGDCLKSSTGSSGSNPYAAWDAGLARSAVTYFNLFMDFASTGVWSAGQDQTLFTVDSVSTIPSAFTATVFVEILYYADATADPDSPDCSAYPCIRIQGRIGGTTLTTHPEVSLNAIHKLRVKVTSGASSGEMYFDGTTMGTGADSNGGGHGAWQYIRIGQVETSKAAETFYWDTLEASDTNYAH